MNDALAYDSYPLPKPSGILAKIKDAKIFSKFDLKSGFWQVCIKEEDKWKTGFTVPKGHYEWNVMPFGLKNAPSAFQRIMDQCFKGMESFIQVYIDDVLVFSPDLDSHFKHLNRFYEAIWNNCLVVSEKKSEMLQTSICFL